MKNILGKVIPIVGVLVFATALTTALMVTATPIHNVSASAPSVASGQCEAVYTTHDVAKVNQPINNLVCPSGYSNNPGNSNCRKWIDDTYKTVVDVPGHYTCPNGWQLSGSTCKKNNKPDQPATWVPDTYKQVVDVPGHYVYADKVNQPIDNWVCPTGSTPHGNGCQVSEQTGWNCNCRDNQTAENGQCMNNPPPTCGANQHVGDNNQCACDSGYNMQNGQCVHNGGGDGNCGQDQGQGNNNGQDQGYGNGDECNQPKTCPSGQVGTYPNCHVACAENQTWNQDQNKCVDNPPTTCPEGQTMINGQCSAPPVSPVQPKGGRSCRDYWNALVRIHHLERYWNTCKYAPGADTNWLDNAKAGVLTWYLSWSPIK